MLLVFRRYDRYESVLSIVYNYNVCKMWTLQVHVGMGLIKVYVFIICFGYKFLIVKSNFYSTVMLLKNDLQFVSIDSISNWVFVIYCFDMSERYVYTVSKNYEFCHENFYFKSHLSLFCWESLYSIKSFSWNYRHVYMPCSLLPTGGTVAHFLSRAGNSQHLNSVTMIS